MPPVHGTAEPGDVIRIVDRLDGVTGPGMIARLPDLDIGLPQAREHDPKPVRHLREAERYLVLQTAMISEDS